MSDEADWKSSLDIYAEESARTDKFGKADLAPILFGLFGEVGEVVSAIKKLKREAKAFVGYRESVEEELGDVLWYFSALCRRLNFSLSVIFLEARATSKTKSISVTQLELDGIIILDDREDKQPSSGDILLGLAGAMSLLVSTKKLEKPTYEKLVFFCEHYLYALAVLGISISKIIQSNLLKVHGRFSIPNLVALPTFDDMFSDDEKLPNEFEIVIKERNNGQSSMQWNGVFIGDPLSDSIRDPDGYRFHDVFHFAHAAILHWSPTFRALIKHKRKSCPMIDDAQDGGRAIVIEEGLTAWIFSCAKLLDFFEGQNRVSYDLLKTVGQFVRGYEVAACPLKLWEDAIIQGYEVFREVRKSAGGVVIGNRGRRRISYRPLRR
jgi:NTP pyrophosphatase (non-canonical NTP hydrolase)